MALDGSVFASLVPMVIMVCQGMVKYSMDLVGYSMVWYGLVCCNMEHYSTLVMAKVPVSAGLHFT